jgi:hypothetical protein
MENKKVYLAKHPLASGLDVEYVKSNLLRIPRIQLVEFGDGIKVKDCAALVIVVNNPSKLNDEIYINEDLFKLIDKFYKENDEEAVFFFTSKEECSPGYDVETTYPLALDLSYYEENDTDSFEEYGIVYFREEIELLPEVSNLIHESASAYQKVPRHYTPPPQFAMPPIESYTKQSKIEAVVVDKLSRVQGRRPLLRAFRAR